MLLPLVTLLPLCQSVPSPAAAVEAWLRTAHGRAPFGLTPGISGVTVSDGKIEAFGLGVQRAGSPVPADGDTLYEIGSLSKTMVALGLATLVTAGTLGWDDPVRKWLGASFALGQEEYVSSQLTVADLLSHRTGLAQGQGDFLGYVYPIDEYTARLAAVDPVHSLRSTFDYSNTGWTLAGQVLRRAANASSWCAALHATLLAPLGLNRTFCHRNEVPPVLATRHLAAVHKADPCRGAAAVATYDFVPTGGPTDFAWGAADAAGSVISSAADMGRVMALLLGVGPPSARLAAGVLEQMLEGQMVTPASWAGECGISPGGGAAPSGGGAGRALAAGFGFDLVTELALAGGAAPTPYAEKNGDTNMHKARLGLLPSRGQGVLLLSSLGGSMGGPLTALKFGALALLAGGSAADADAAAAAALNTTGFWEEQWAPETTCTPCGRSGASGPCLPSGRAAPPQPASAFAGRFGTAAYGASVLSLAARADGGLALSLGPLAGAPLRYSNTSLVREQPCAAMGAWLEASVASWGWPQLQRLAALAGECTLVEWILPPEVAAAGISAANGTVAFPWGCGPVPLPDGPSIYVVSHGGRGALAVFMGEALGGDGV